MCDPKGQDALFGWVKMPIAFLSVGIAKMWPKQNLARQNLERERRTLLSRIEAASQPTADLVAELLQHACPRLQSAIGPNDAVKRLIEAQAWLDLGFWLIGWELPDWSIHRLSCDDQRWNCAICVRGLAINWIEDVAEFQHDHPALATMGALVQAQILKMQGRAPSNVTPFRRMENVGAGPITHQADR